MKPHPCASHDKPDPACQACEIKTLKAEVARLQTKVAFWNTAWHEQRVLTGKSFWMTPYPRTPKV